MIPPSYSRLSTQQVALAKRCLSRCGVIDELIVENLPLSGHRVGLVAFAHRPFDVRSASIAIIPEDEDSERAVASCREIGASRVFVAGSQSWEIWRLHAAPGAPPTRERPFTLKTSDVERYFERERKHLDPHAIFRAKVWRNAAPGSQSDFVDAGFLPAVEHEAGQKLGGVFRAMMHAIMAECEWKKKVPDSIADARWLIKSCFFLLSAKLFHERRNDHNGIPSFRSIDWSDVDTIFTRVAKHYSSKNPQRPTIKTKRQFAALRAAADIARHGPHFPHISAETLGELYSDELLDRDTRRRLNIYRTPTYLVDYMIAKLSPWIEAMDVNSCRIFEPACGHAPFLTGALRLLSDMLPPHLASDQAKRHTLLRDNLHGCDVDNFALDIARLSLTLADIPRENGWVLEGGDMYQGDRLKKGVEAASVVLCNPPFRGEQAATLLRRTIAALKPGAVFGLVVPVNELTSSATAAVRAQMLHECELREISVFSDKMFATAEASVETGILLGRKLPVKKIQFTGTLLFRRVREPKKEIFERSYGVSWEDRVAPAWLAEQNDGSFIVPELRELWKACEHLPKLGKVVVGQGLFHIGRDKLPLGTITESGKPFLGAVQGFASVADSGDTHLEPAKAWINLDDSVVDRKVAGATVGAPQIVMNYAPVDRDAWRLKAFVDEVGRPATSRFLVMRPGESNLPLGVLWALANSPFANGYAFSMATKRDITVGTMRKMRIPEFSQKSTHALENAVTHYLNEARKFTRLLAGQTKPSRATKTKQRSREANDDGLELPLPGVLTDAEEQTRREKLRALHWRVDAEVLKLYALPPERERDLLDFFDGIPRVGVPFVQTEYIPRDFRDVHTLDEYLRITDEWDVTNIERQRLLDKDYEDTITPAEKAELKKLQRLLMLRRRRYAPMDCSRVDAALTVLGVVDSGLSA